MTSGFGYGSSSVPMMRPPKLHSRTGTTSQSSCRSRSQKQGGHRLGLPLRAPLGLLPRRSHRTLLADPLVKVPLPSRRASLNAVHSARDGAATTLIARGFVEPERDSRDADLNWGI